MNPVLLLFPLTGALIGWVTNYLAIRLLFRPHRPWGIRSLGLTFQGILPRRREALARSVGQIVAEQLLTCEDILGNLRDDRLRGEVSTAVARAVGSRVQDRIPGFIPRQLSSSLAGYVAETARKEADEFMANSMEEMLKNIGERLDIAGMVEGRLNSYALEDIEKLAYNLAGRELRAIELLGAVLGFLVGAGQALLAVSL